MLRCLITRQSELCLTVYVFRTQVQGPPGQAITDPKPPRSHRGADHRDLEGARSRSLGHQFVQLCHLAATAHLHWFAASARSCICKLALHVIFSKKTLEENNYDLRKVLNIPGTGPFRTQHGVENEVQRHWSRDSTRRIFRAEATNEWRNAVAAV